MKYFRRLSQTKSFRKWKRFKKIRFSIELPPVVYVSATLKTKWELDIPTDCPDLYAKIMKRVKAKKAVDSNGRN